MPLLTGDQVYPAFTDGLCSRAILLALKNVDAADTVDLAPWLKVIKRVGMVSDTNTHVASCTFAGTTVTIPTGPLDDAIWLLAVGVAA